MHFPTSLDTYKKITLVTAQFTIILFCKNFLQDSSDVNETLKSELRWRLVACSVRWRLRPSQISRRPRRVDETDTFQKYVSGLSQDRDFRNKITSVQDRIVNCAFHCRLPVNSDFFWLIIYMVSLGSPLIMTTTILFLQCRPNSDAQRRLMLARKART